MDTQGRVGARGALVRALVRGAVEKARAGRDAFEVQTGGRRSTYASAFATTASTMQAHYGGSTALSPMSVIDTGHALTCRSFPRRSARTFLRERHRRVPDREGRRRPRPRRDRTEQVRPQPHRKAIQDPRHIVPRESGVREIAVWGERDARMPESLMISSPQRSFSMSRCRARFFFLKALCPSSRGKRGFERGTSTGARSIPQ